MKNAATDISLAKPEAKGKPKQTKPPAQFHPECQHILDLLALGSAVRAAAQTIGVARLTFYTWAK